MASRCRSARPLGPAGPPTRRPAAGRPASGSPSSSPSMSAAMIAAVRTPMIRAAASARRAVAKRASRPSRSARTRISPVSGPVAGRWPCRNVSRSRKAEGSHDASSTLRTSSRPADRSAPEAITTRCAASARRPAMPSAAASSRVPAASSAPSLVAVQRPLRQLGGDHGRGYQRAEVAHGVTPALVELAGLDHQVGQRAGRRPPADGDHRGPCAAVPGRAQRGVRRGRRSLVGDADDQAPDRPRQGELEGLGRDDGRGPQAGRRGRVTEDLDDPEGGGLGRATAGDDDRFPGGRRRPGSPPRGPLRCRPPRSAPRCARPGLARPRSCRSCDTADPIEWLGVLVKSHGSGGPGRGAVGSNSVAVVMASSVRRRG